MPCHAEPRPARGLRRAGRACIALALAVAAALAGAQTASVGEAIYMRGQRADGQPIVASREGELRSQGAQAACVNCHRRSGLGAKEGRTSVPPITGRYLFTPHAADDDGALPFVDTMRLNRAPYTEASLARAIRDGVDADGRAMSYLMPRFALDDAEMASLLAYLREMDQRKLPGVTDTVLHFATIITPDADPVQRRGMLDVLQRYFDDKNATSLGPSARLKSSRKMMFLVSRRWQLHVWQLSGDESTWGAQLQQHFRDEPVLAAVAGLAGRSWAPVHRFCEQQRLPCLFAHVESPPADADRDFYSMYFSRGLLLESELMAHALADARQPGARRVLQLVRAGDAAESAAAHAAQLLKAQGVPVRTHRLAADAAPAAAAQAVRLRQADEALLLWLRPKDLQSLGDAAPPDAPVLLSGTLAGLERAPLPAAWRERAVMAYPFDLPERRRVRVDYALGWFGIRHIAVVDEQLQADTYLACGLLSETLAHMADTFVPEYVVERLQDMLEHRVMTGYYPRLSLAQGQRFASKGGYLVRFAEPAGTKVVAVKDWFVPDAAAPAASSAHAASP
jgi:hypothetical protein